MDSKKILRVIGIYRERLEKSGVAKLDFPHDKFSPKPNHVVEHAHGMLDEISEFVAQGRLEKAHRWLGFVQCALWSTGRYTLNDLKDHNRSPDQNI